MYKTVVLSLLLSCAIITSFAQSPQKFLYQAIARDAGGVALANQAVSFQLSIVQNNPSGSILYQEIHPVTTNQFGLANIEVGTGLVVSGDFITIEWGSDLHFIQVEMDPLGGFAFQFMGVTQLLSVPYALHASTVENDMVDDADADPNNEIQSLSIVGNDLSISDGNTVSIPSVGGGGTLDNAYDFGGAGLGRDIDADAGAVTINSNIVDGVGLFSGVSNTGSVAISANSSLAGNAFSTIQTVTNSNSTQASAILAHSDGAAWGIAGQASPAATAEAAIYGSNLRTNGGHGIMGIGFNGLVGQTNYRAGYAVYGENFDALGSTANNAVGVAGRGYYGVLGEDRYLGAVSGAYGVFSNGELGSSGFKSFQIDHPQDPLYKYLRHFCIESNEVLNVYRGNAILNGQGQAIVELPNYFEDININFSYHLTPIGTHADVFVLEEVQDGKFSIGGGVEGMKVSWILYAERNDAYARTYPEKKQVEIEKTERDQGKYLMPRLYGAEESEGVFKQVDPVEQKPLNMNPTDK